MSKQFKNLPVHIFFRTFATDCEIWSEICLITLQILRRGRYSRGYSLATLPTVSWAARARDAVWTSSLASLAVMPVLSSGLRAESSLLNLKAIDIKDVRKEVYNLLVSGENIIAAFKTIRDQVVFTDKRIFVINVQGVTGKKTVPLLWTGEPSLCTPGRENRPCVHGFFCWQAFE